MKSAFLRSFALLAGLGLAACQTTNDGRSMTGGRGGGDGVDVTRFHLGQPIARGPIAVEASNPSLTATPEYRMYEASVARELARLGWTVVPGVGASEQVAIVNVQQGTREAMRSRPPVTIGVGGGTGGWRSGVGGGVSFGVGGGPRAVTGTLLEVRLKRRSDGSVIWEGRASSESPVRSPLAQPGAAVDRLAAALFRDFPGDSGRTIRVR